MSTRLLWRFLISTDSSWPGSLILAREGQPALWVQDPGVGLLPPVVSVVRCVSAPFHTYAADGDYTNAFAAFLDEGDLERIRNRTKCCFGYGVPRPWGP